jgi:hypothetical protein
MGIVYAGPYADDVNYDALHEGYAGRLWPDGRITGSWGGDVGWTGHSGLVAACDCGWRSDRIHPPGDYESPEYEAAERDFETEHLTPLIEAAKRRSWPDWVARVTARAEQVAWLVAGDQFDDAADILGTLRDDVDHREAVLADLALDRDSAAAHDSGSTVPARPFGPIGDGPVALPGPPTSTAVSAPPPIHPHTR